MRLNPFTPTIAVLAIMLASTPVASMATAQNKTTPKASVESKKGVAPAAQEESKLPSIADAKKNGEEAIGPAITRVQDIDDRVGRFAKTLEEAAELNRRMTDLKSEGKSREAIRRALIEYESMVEDFRKVKRDVKIIAPDLKDSLSKASPEFNRAAEEYERKAATEKFPAHQEKYREMAKEARKHADDYKKDHDEFDAKVQLVLDLIEFVEANGRLARDMRKHLDLHRDAAKAAYLDRLITVIGIQQRQFDKIYVIWREHLDRRRGAIQDGQPVRTPEALPFPGVPPFQMEGIQPPKN